MNGNFPIIAIEVAMVFGGVLLFGWWQLRSIKRDQEAAAAQKRAQATAEQQAESGPQKNRPGE